MVDFHPLINRNFPRILTQLNRDPNTAHYGSFDRNWWHYKIRDFSSIILQQGGYFLEMAAKLPEYADSSEQLYEYSRATVDFWVKRANKKGAFEEYYPWENGYPPLAFSTLAVAKIIQSQNLETTRSGDALKKAARKLQQRFEPKAANQQIAGLAALAILKKINPELVDNNIFSRISEQTLALQSNEGWFTEYDGPDLGYLSVSLDCLWDLFDNTEDQKFADSANRAFRFLAKLVIHNQGSIGMHNSRNTDYIVPYGICRFLNSDNNTDAIQAKQVIEILYSNTDNSEHFFQAVDDRYWSHYIGHSIVRAQQILDVYSFKRETSYLAVNAESLWKECGYAIVAQYGHRVMISLLKGGIISIKNQTNYFNDFGWIIFDGKKQYVTHWWTPANQYSANSEELQVSGYAVQYKENTSTPFKHFLLRTVSYFSGDKIIALLKNLLIFRKSDQKLFFKRNIKILSGNMVITDEISGLKGNEIIVKAPRFSKRHVASADSFHHEDMLMVNGYVCSTKTQKNGNIFKASTLVNLD
ncbi:MAG: hypothetical protein RBS07_02070 [Lentimicrobium sp.]|jgi:hypothetical protein|nr:hypothetical protein [Lentimicrobium sp.]